MTPTSQITIEQDADIVQMVRMRAAGHMFAVSVGSVCDVLKQMEITPIPLSPSFVMGALNLRGRIVTVIDLRKRLNMQAAPEQHRYSGIVIEQEGELYCLLVDKVLEVLDVDATEIQEAPKHLSPDWLEVTSGVYPMGEELVVMLDSEALLSNF